MNPLGKRVIVRSVVVLVAALLVAALTTQGAAAATWTQTSDGRATFWYRDGAARFLHDTGVQKWYHCSQYGGWIDMGWNGDAFIGDGALHLLSNGFQYR